MSKDRIQLDGVWYVKEDQQVTEPIEVEYVFSEECVVETDKYCYVASRIKKDDGTFYDCISVEFTSKSGTRNEWKTDYWDNENWLRGLLTNNPESIPEFIEMVPEKREQEVFIQFLKKLIEIKWLTENK